MKLELPVTALDHYYAFTKAVQRDDSRYQEAAEWFRARLPKEDEPEGKAASWTRQP